MATVSNDWFQAGEVDRRREMQEYLDLRDSLKGAKRLKTGHNPDTTTGLCIGEDELAKHQAESRRKKELKAAKAAAVGARKTKSSEVHVLRAGQAQHVLQMFNGKQDWQKQPAAALCGALRSLAGEDWWKANKKKQTKAAAVKELPAFLRKVASGTAQPTVAASASAVPSPQGGKSRLLFQKRRQWQFPNRFRSKFARNFHFYGRLDRKHF